MHRRNFLKYVGLSGLTALVPAKLLAEAMDPFANCTSRASGRPIIDLRDVDDSGEDDGPWAKDGKNHRNSLIVQSDAESIKEPKYVLKIHFEGAIIDENLPELIRRAIPSNI